MTVYLRRDPPDGYPVSSYCASCGRDFAADTYFDRHRIGVHAYTYSEGLKQEPQVEDGRRCMTDEELRAAGLRPMTDQEQRRSRHRRRAGHGVQLWFDPAKAERLRHVHVTTAIPVGGTPQDATTAPDPTQNMAAAKTDIYGAFDAGPPAA